MKKILFDKKLYVFLFIVFTFFGIFTIMNYSVDTYLLLAQRFEYLKEFLSAGRFITAFVFLVFAILHLPPYVMYLLSFIAAIIFATLSIYELNNVLDKYVSNKVLSAMLAIMIIINPFIIELWLFIEMGVLMLSIFASVEAFKYFDACLEKESLGAKDFKKPVAWMILAVFSYQGTVALFVALSLISILKYSKKSFLKTNLYLLLIYGIPCVLNYILTLPFSTRVGGDVNLLESIKVALTATFTQILFGFGLFPKFFLPTITAISLILITLTIIKDKKKTRKTMILSVIYLIGMTYIFSILPTLFQNTDNIVVFPRTTYALASLLGTLFILLNKKINNKVIIALISILLVGEFISFSKVAINRYIVNYKDMEIVKQIEEKVVKYEAATNQKIEKIAIYKSDDSRKFYAGINDNINVSAISSYPSNLALYTYVTNRKLEEVDEVDYVYDRYFASNKWEEFSLDQTVIISGVLHWYIY